MHLPRLFVFPCLAVLFLMPAMARAQEKVEVKGVHLCCPACVKAVEAVIKPVKGTCDKKTKTISFTADPLSAQLILDELARAGFYGTTNSKKIKMRSGPAFAAGKVKTLTIVGIHNCCGSCCKAIKDAVKKVDGVTGDTAKPKVSTFEVTGNFNPADVVKALNDAGFNAGVKGGATEGTKLK